MIVGVVSFVQLSSANARLQTANAETKEFEQEASSALEELEDVEDDLENARQELKSLRRDRREAEQALTLQQALESGSATKVSGLSADITSWNCTSGNCRSIQGAAEFANTTEVSSAVTCVFRAEFEDGQETHFTAYAEYVPGDGSTVATFFYSTAYESGLETTWDSDECYRGIAQYFPGE